MTVAIYANMRKDVNLEITSKVASILETRCKVVSLKNFESFDQMCASSDALVVLGGDGTLLRVAGKACQYNVPILGINLGTIGFLAEIEKNRIDDCLERFLNGDYTIDERFMIKADVIHEGEVVATHHALNDIIVSSSSFKKVVSTNLFINDEFTTSYASDGVIFATPTGSTAYSLSAGGPITDSSMELILVTPICPHTLSSRPLILPPDKKVSLEILKDRAGTTRVTYDGCDGESIALGDKVIISASERKTKLIKVNGMNFYEVLRKKLSN